MRVPDLDTGLSVETAAVALLIQLRTLCHSNISPFSCPVTIKSLLMLQETAVIPAEH